MPLSARLFLFVRHSAGKGYVMETKEKSLKDVLTAWENLDVMFTPEEEIGCICPVVRIMAKRIACYFTECDELDEYAGKRAIELAKEMFDDGHPEYAAAVLDLIIAAVELYEYSDEFDMLAVCDEVSEDAYWFFMDEFFADKDIKDRLFNFKLRQSVENLN